MLNHPGKCGQFRAAYPAQSSFLSKATVLLSALALLISVVAVVQASEGDGRFWRDLGLSQDPSILLREILSRGEFKESNWTWLFSALLRWLSELFGRLFDLILELLRKFFGRGNVEAEVFWPALGAFFAAMFVAGALVALYYALRSFLLRKDDRPDMPLSSFAAAGRSSSEMLGLSRSMAERGEYREALIHLFRYVLMRLDEQGRLGFYTGKTNREILRSSSLRPSDRSVLSEMVPIFNGVRYGNFPCGKQEYDRFLSLTGSLVGVGKVQ